MAHYHCGQSAPDYSKHLINGVGLSAKWNVDIVFVGKTFIIVLDIPDVQQKMPAGIDTMFKDEFYLVTEKFISFCSKRT
jgi:hypothetical protein